MLLQLIAHQPQVLGTILKNTPQWVWGVLAALTWLGLSQLRARSVSVSRVTLMPVAMTAFSVWGTVSAFGASSQFGAVLLAWFTAAAVVAGLVSTTRTPATYSSAENRFHMPGSVIPLLLIIGIFLTKYVVGVELAMQPQLVRDVQFTLVVGALYGVFNGLFLGRAIRLWRLMRPAAPTGTAVNA